MSDTFTIREFLNENFLSEEGVEKYFFETFGVNVSKFENFYLFKYDQILANWNEKIVSECRGIILQKTDVWNYVSIPFKKFFNLQEGRCEFFDEKKFDENISNIRLLEKLDGSCIQLWFDGTNWRASTLGSIQTASVGDFDFTFSDLFWKIFKNSGFETKNLIVGHTYIFELWSKYNQVVTQYAEEMIVLLGVRNLNTFQLNAHTEEQIQNIFPKVRRPICLDVSFNSKEELFELVEKLSENEEIFGKIPEGFVGYCDGRPVFKVKNQRYSQAHRILTGDRAFVLKNVVASVFCGNVDDIYGDLTDELKEFVDRLKVDILRRIEKVERVANQLFLFDMKTDAKQYALKLNSFVVADEELFMFRAFMFDKKKEVCQNGKVGHLVLDWLTEKNRFEKWIDVWREV
jgi:hypothetical protein